MQKIGGLYDLAVSFIGKLIIIKKLYCSSRIAAIKEGFGLCTFSHEHKETSRVLEC
jgi:hypothetical protein